MTDEQNPNHIDLSVRGRFRDFRRDRLYERPQVTRPLDISSHVSPLIRDSAQLVSVALNDNSVIDNRVVRENAIAFSVLKRAVRQQKLRPDMPKQSKSKVLKRHANKVKLKKRRPKYRRPLQHTIVGITASLALLAGIGGIINLARHDQQQNAGNDVLSSSVYDEKYGTTPSEDEPPEDFSTYIVPKNAPRFITIQRINVRARVIAQGIGVQGLPKDPKNIFDVAWYEDSAIPGTVGTTVMNGHVSGSEKTGIFYNVSSLRTGDKIIIEQGDGNILTYSIKATQIYSNSSISMDIINKSFDPTKPALNIITSTGRYIKKTNQFEQRLVIQALLE